MDHSQTTQLQRFLPRAPTAVPSAPYTSQDLTHVIGVHGFPSRIVTLLSKHSNMERKSTYARVIRASKARIRSMTSVNLLHERDCSASHLRLGLYAQAEQCKCRGRRWDEWRRLLDQIRRWPRVMYDHSAPYFALAATGRGLARGPGRIRFS